QKNVYDSKSSVFSSAAVLSLDCYVCSSAVTNEECNTNNEECQEPQDTCMTVVDILVISKQCASQATCNGAAASASVDSSGNGNTVDCCNSFNLCNFSGAESVHIHTAVKFCCSVLVLSESQWWRV
uniref:UPAR/Ly6 domain-containing protein n=1 Tax=Labrus bergylta TaxID=56723 RepID=A0A3Q3GI63_9LABR